MPFVRFHVFVQCFCLYTLLGCQDAIDLGHRSEVLNHQVCIELCLLSRKTSHLSFVKLPVRSGSGDLLVNVLELRVESICDRYHGVNNPLYLLLLSIGEIERTRHMLEHVTMPFTFAMHAWSLESVAQSEERCADDQDCDPGDHQNSISHSSLSSGCRPTDYPSGRFLYTLLYARLVSFAVKTQLSLCKVL